MQTTIYLKRILNEAGKKLETKHLIGLQGLLSIDSNNSSVPSILKTSNEDMGYSYPGANVLDNTIIAPMMAYLRLGKDSRSGKENPRITLTGNNTDQINEYKKRIINFITGCY